MNRSRYRVPEFSPAGPDFRFLASEDKRYIYSHLYGFAEWLHQETFGINFSEERPLTIITDSCDELVFLIAASFLLQIPVLPLHPDTTEEELSSLPSGLTPSLIFDPEKRTGNSFSSMRHLEIPENALKLKAGWNDNLFTLSKPEKIAGLFLTSGSTNRPKLVRLKRRQLFFATSESAENFKPEINHYWLLCLPLNHVGGISIIYRSILYNSAIFRLSTFDENQIRKYLSEDKTFQVASMVPTMLVKLIEDPLFQAHFDFRAILVGGGPISLEVINRSLTKGLPIVTSYGMTETCAQIAANPMLKPSGTYLPKMSVGTIFSPNEIEIRDDNRKIIPRNESGQVWLRGPQIFDGYTDPELNKNVFDEDGWFNTGDFGHLNRKNQLFIESRRTDLILTGGENVNPAEVESALNSFDEIAESAVTGVPDKLWGQRVVAFIVPIREMPSEEDLREKLKKRLNGFKIPKEFLRLDSLPKTGSHKIKRTELQKLYAEFGK